MFVAGFDTKEVCAAAVAALCEIGATLAAEVRASLPRPGRQTQQLHASSGGRLVLAGAATQGAGFRLEWDGAVQRPSPCPPRHGSGSFRAARDSGKGGKSM